MLRAEAVIVNKLGLHARPSAKIAQLATKYRSEVWMSKGTRRINAKSIMGVMMLAAAKGSTLVSRPTARRTGGGGRLVRADHPRLRRGDLSAGYDPQRSRRAPGRGTVGSGRKSRDAWHRRVDVQRARHGDRRGHRDRRARVLESQRFDVARFHLQAGQAEEEVARLEAARAEVKAELDALASTCPRTRRPRPVRCSRSTR